MQAKKTDVVEVTGDTTLRTYKDIDFDWSELVQMHKIVSDELVNNGMRFKSLIVEVVALHGEEDIGVQKALIIGEATIGKLAKTLGEIQAKHSHMNGRLKNKEDYWLATQLIGHYKEYRNDMLVSLGAVLDSLITLNTDLNKDKADNVTTIHNTQET